MNLEYSWEYSSIPHGESFINHLMLSIQTPPDPSQTGRNPIAVVLVIDKSWSMKGEKLEAVREAASAFIRWMTRADYIGVIAYSVNAEIIQPMTRAVEKQGIINNLHSVEPGTSTNLSAGWLQAVQMLKNIDSKDTTIKRILLLTDGLATAGIQEQDQLELVASGAAKEGIQVTTIGFGSDFNEDSLKGIAKAGLGNFYYVDSPEKTSDIFFQEFGSIGNLFSQATSLKLNFPEGTNFKELLNDLPYQVDANTVEVNVGDLRCDDYLQLVFNTSCNLTSSLAIQAKLNYFQVAGKFSEHNESLDIPIKILDSDPVINNEVQIEVLLLSATKTLIHASELSKTDSDSANRILENMINRLEASIELDRSLLEPVMRRLEGAQTIIKKRYDQSGKELISSAIALKQSRLDNLSDTKRHNEIYFHSFKGDLDLYNAPEIKQTAQRKLNEGFRFLVYDFSEVSFIDSSAIGALIQISSWLSKRNGILVVMNLSSSLEKIFNITRINSYIPVAESETGARLLIEQFLNRSTQSD
jgi:Ca-activated chloride channel homolog